MAKTTGEAGARQRPRREGGRRGSPSDNHLDVVLGTIMIAAVRGEALSTVDILRFLTQITLRVPGHS